MGAALKEKTVDFVKPFVEGTIQVLKIQCQTDIKPTTPFFKNEKEGLHPDIMAVIEVKSKDHNGHICLSFSKEAFLGTMEQLIGERYEEIDDEIKDGAAELLNMIFGHAKTQLNQDGHALEMARPEIKTGHEISGISFSSKQPIFVAPFNSPFGNLQVEFDLY